MYEKYKLLMGGGIKFLSFLQMIYLFRLTFCFINIPSGPHAGYSNISVIRVMTFQISDIISLDILTRRMKNGQSLISLRRVPVFISNHCLEEDVIVRLVILIY